MRILIKIYDKSEKSLLFFCIYFATFINLVLKIFQKRINFFTTNAKTNGKTYLLLIRFSIIFFFFFIICNLPLRFFGNLNYIYFLIVFFTLLTILVNYFRNKI